MSGAVFFCGGTQGSDAAVWERTTQASNPKSITAPASVGRSQRKGQSPPEPDKPRFAQAIRLRTKT